MRMMALVSVMGMVWLLGGCAVNLYVTPNVSMHSTSAAATPVAAVTVTPIPAPSVVKVPAVAPPKEQTCVMSVFPYLGPTPQPESLRSPDVDNLLDVNEVLADHIVELRQHIALERQQIRAFYNKQLLKCAP